MKESSSAWMCLAKITCKKSHGDLFVAQNDFAISGAGIDKNAYWYRTKHGVKRQSLNTLLRKAIQGGRKDGPVVNALEWDSGDRVQLLPLLQIFCVT